MPKKVNESAAGAGYLYTFSAVHFRRSDTLSGGCFNTFWGVLSREARRQKM